MINVPFIGVLTYCVTSGELLTKAAAANLTLLGETKLELRIVNFKTTATIVVFGQVEPSYEFS